MTKLTNVLALISFFSKATKTPLAPKTTTQLFSEYCKNNPSAASCKVFDC